MDPDPAIVVSDLQDVIKNLLLITYFLKVQLHHFSKIKRHTEVPNKTEEIDVFLTIFCLIKEGSGSVSLIN
jgi:hypothetical protein